MEILRHTGMRIEELKELGHHSIINCKLPTTGEVIPLLQIAPSKSNQERLLLVSPELADVLSAVISRVRGHDGRCRASRPTTYTRRCGTLPCRCSTNGLWAVRTGRSPLLRSASRSICCGGYRHHRRQRTAPDLPAARLPQNLHHRRHPHRSRAGIPSGSMPGGWSYCRPRRRPRPRPIRMRCW